MKRVEKNEEQKKVSSQKGAASMRGYPILLAALIFWGTLLLFRSEYTFDLDKTQIEKEIGCNYIWKLKKHPILYPFLIFENDEKNASSTLIIYEEQVPLPGPHAIHDTIRQQGGHYSHWLKNKIYFSPSDCSNPIENDRNYRVSLKASFSSYSVFIITVLLALFVVRRFLQNKTENSDLD